jgi:GH24 family phage-related lysozyme (muramidase)
MPDFLENQEGLRLKSYQDEAGNWTIGYGSIMYQDGTPVGPNQTITKEKAQELRDWEVNRKSESIRELIYPQKVNEKQMEMLISLVYNIGVEGFRTSTLLKLIKNDANDKTKITMSSVGEQNVRKWMIDNKMTEISRIMYSFLLWNKVRDPKTKRLKFSQGLFARRIREANGYLNAMEK